MAQKMEYTTTRRVARWAKWKGLRVVQLLGFALVVIGAYPYLRPFVASIAAPPPVVDTFVASFFPTVSIGSASVPALRSVVFIALGAIVIWVATSRRFH